MDKLPFEFGTVGSPTSTPKRPGGSVGAVIRIRELGLSALELGWVNAVRISEKSCAEIQATGKEQDVRISVHASYFINVNAHDDEWPKSRQRIMDAAHYGYLAGATDIIFHPGSYFGNPPDTVLPKVIQRLSECVADLRDAGNPVILRPETMGKSAMIGSLEDTLQMAKEIKGIEPCLDFAHLHARPGDGSMNTHQEWRQVLEKYAHTLGEKALHRLHVHLSGIEYGPKGERKHLPIEEADLDLKALFRALQEFGCQGRILCESPEMEDDALKMQALYTKIML